MSTVRVGPPYPGSFPYSEPSCSYAHSVTWSTSCIDSMLSLNCFLEVRYTKESRLQEVCAPQGKRTISLGICHPSGIKDI